MAQSIETLPNGLSLRQDDRFFKLGQDSVLLSAFAQPPRQARLLDLACGTGVLALLCYRPGMTLTGLDSNRDALALFARSLADNGLTAALHCADLRQIRQLLPAGSFDYAVCNPPYFSDGAGAQSKTHSAARQQSCAVTDVAQALAFALRDGGKCALCYRPERLLSLTQALLQHRLPPKRLRFVQQRPDAAPSVVLVECRKGGSPEGLRVEPPLFVESDEYCHIYEK